MRARLHFEIFEVVLVIVVYSAHKTKKMQEKEICAISEQLLVVHLPDWLVHGMFSVVIVVMKMMQLKCMNTLLNNQ